ncbi:GH3 auxin-responsive promoter [compost metagenome]
MKTNAVIREYTVAPIYMDGNAEGKHEWLIEFDRKPNDINRFMYLLDESLRSINSDYDAKRTSNMALGKPLLHILKSGSFDAWLQKKGKLGGQHKVPRLMNSREIVEQILQETDYETIQYA